MMEQLREAKSKSGEPMEVDEELDMEGNAPEE